jgi:hypothetical protein
MKKVQEHTASLVVISITFLDVVANLSHSEN